MCACGVWKKGEKWYSNKFPRAFGKGLWAVWKTYTGKPYLFYNKQYFNIYFIFNLDVFLISFNRLQEIFRCNFKRSAFFLLQKVLPFSASGWSIVSLFFLFIFSPILRKRVPSLSLSLLLLFSFCEAFQRRSHVVRISLYILSPRLFTSIRDAALMMIWTVHQNSFHSLLLALSLLHIQPASMQQVMGVSNPSFR